MKHHLIQDGIGGAVAFNRSVITGFDNFKTFSERLEFAKLSANKLIHNVYDEYDWCVTHQLPKNRVRGTKCEKCFQKKYGQDNK